jgi:hypothetical protein
MKNFMKKNWALIGLIVAFFVDHSFDILKNSGLTELSIELIKGLGAIISGYYWTSKYNVNLKNSQKR